MIIWIGLLLIVVGLALLLKKKTESFSLINPKPCDYAAHPPNCRTVCSSIPTAPCRIECEPMQYRGCTALNTVANHCATAIRGRKALPYHIFGNW